MHVSSILTLLALAPAALAEFKFPLKNGFPMPDKAAISKIQTQAGGTLPNTPLPKKAGDEAILDFQIIAVNEIFEVAFFTELLTNVTKGGKGFETSPQQKRYLIKSLKEIRAQEELHALGANAILESVGQKAIGGCRYNFPVTDLKSALTLAQTFTDLVLGALPAIQHDLATTGLADLIPLIGSILAQEGEQVGFYRYTQGKVPSAAPFLTGNSGIFAANALLQLFIIPNSCSELPKVPILAPLSITTANVTTATKSLSFSVPSSKAKPTTANYITYLSGQNLPVSVPITNVKTVGGATTFTAEFPFSGGFSKGLTLAAVTKGKGPYSAPTAPNDVAKDSIAGPGIIEIE